MSTMHYGYVHIYAPTHPRAHHNGCVSEHILIAERVLGYPLPLKAVVHHVNEIRHENRNNNLVICENSAYHTHLHRRMKALKLGGSVHALQCLFCKKWDVLGSNGMVVHRRSTENGRFANPYHPLCRNAQRREKAIARTGKILSEEHRRNISLSLYAYNQHRTDPRLTA